MLNTIHHIALICSGKDKVIDFYVNTLGFPVIRENYRPDKNDWKIDLLLSGDLNGPMLSSSCLSFHLLHHAHPILKRKDCGILLLRSLQSQKRSLGLRNEASSVSPYAPTPIQAKP